MEAMQEKGIPDKTIKFSTNVLDDFRKNVGKYRAETGVESMSQVFREWKSNGYETNGIYHSHPIGCIRPSYHDISTALLHLRFFELDYFYLPIFQNERRGFYTMYFYVVRQETDCLNINLEYVLKATEDGYVYAPLKKWNRDYSIKQLDAYRDGINRQTENVVNKETESCPRCLLGSRFEKYENGFENDVDSSACTIFATERMQHGSWKSWMCIEVS